MMTTNLVETMWLVRYPLQVETMYDRGGEFPGHKFQIAGLKRNMVLRLGQLSPGTYS